jgi:hypothetical protein
MEPFQPAFDAPPPPSQKAVDLGNTLAILDWALARATAPFAKHKLESALAYLEEQYDYLDHGNRTLMFVDSFVTVTDPQEIQLRWNQPKRNPHA